MTIRLLPVGVLLSCLVAPASHAQVVLTCGPLLDEAINAPIPASLIRGNTVLTFTGNEVGLELLSNHVASVTIGRMSGAYVGLSDNPGRCAAIGCDAFVYVTSNGVGAVSRPIRIDSTSILRVWDFSTGVFAHDPMIVDVFLAHRISPVDNVVANIFTTEIEANVYWAGVNEEIQGVNTWLSIDDDAITIPFFLLSERERRTRFPCE